MINTICFTFTVLETIKTNKKLSAFQSLLSTIGIYFITIIILFTVKLYFDNYQTTNLLALSLVEPVKLIIRDSVEGDIYPVLTGLLLLSAFKYIANKIKNFIYDFY